MVIVGSLAALGLSAVFWVASAAKLRNLPSTRRGFVAIRLPGWIVYPVVVVEAGVALSLLVAPRLGGAMAVLLLIGFTATLIRAKRLIRSSGVSGIRCNCFGSSSEITAWTFLRNAGLIAAALLALAPEVLHLSVPALLVGGMAVAGGGLARQIVKLRQSTGSLFPGVPAQPNDLFAGGVSS